MSGFACVVLREARARIMSGADVSLVWVSLTAEDVYVKHLAFAQAVPRWACGRARLREMLSSGIVARTWTDVRLVASLGDATAGIRNSALLRATASGGGGS